MKFESEFTPIALDELHHEAAVMKVDGWRFIQTHAVNTDNGIDLYYSFMKNGHIKNLKVAALATAATFPKRKKLPYHNVSHHPSELPDTSDE